MSIRDLQAPTINVKIARDIQHPEQLVGVVRKSWWAGPGVGGVGRHLGEVWVDVSGMSEGEAVAAVLSDLALAVRGGLYDL